MASELRGWCGRSRPKRRRGCLSSSSSCSGCRCRSVRHPRTRFASRQQARQALSGAATQPCCRPQARSSNGSRTINTGPAMCPCPGTVSAATQAQRMTLCLGAGELEEQNAALRQQEGSMGSAADDSAGSLVVSTARAADLFGCACACSASPCHCSGPCLRPCGRLCALVCARASAGWRCTACMPWAAAAGSLAQLGHSVHSGPASASTQWSRPCQPPLPNPEHFAGRCEGLLCAAVWAWRVRPESAPARLLVSLLGRPNPADTGPDQGHDQGAAPGAPTTPQRCRESDQLQAPARAAPASACWPRAATLGVPAGRCARCPDICCFAGTHTGACTALPQLPHGSCGLRPGAEPTRADLLSMAARV